ncbi:hypothetical protein RJ55_08678 [Drechmeria coniospora]|nr:hypothetical protein RJ55_08678 [Drechmeria coniospora]
MKAQSQGLANLPYMHVLDAPQDETQTAIYPDGDDSNTIEQNDKPKTTRRIANAIRRIGKGSVGAFIKINEASAFVGGSNAKDRLGIFEDPKNSQDAGPTRFPARYQGKKGYAYITTTATTPAVSWRLETEEPESAWTVALADITELQKVGGLGWKSKTAISEVLGWEVADGMLLRTKQGTEFHLTAITLRDEMFNRIISIRGHMWEML